MVQIKQELRNNDESTAKELSGVGGWVGCLPLFSTSALPMYTSLVADRIAFHDDVHVSQLVDSYEFNNHSATGNNVYMIVTTRLYSFRHPFHLVLQ